MSGGSVGKRIAELSVVIPIVVFAAACQKFLAGGQIEASIHSDLNAQGVDLASIHCPPKTAAHKGAKLACIGTDALGNTATFSVTQTDDLGAIDWKVDAQIIDTKKFGDALEAQLGDQLGKQVDVQCVAQGVITKVGRPFACLALVDGQPARVACTTSDDQGHATCNVSDR